MTTPEEIYQYANESYGTTPECPFKNSNAVTLKHNNGKWYALVMQVTADKLGLDGTDLKNIINFKCDPLLTGNIRNGKSIFPAYHMNKEHWITVLLDEAPPEDVFFLMDMSYRLTYTKNKTKKSKK